MADKDDDARKQDYTGGDTAGMDETDEAGDVGFGGQDMGTDERGDNTGYEDDTLEDDV